MYECYYYSIHNDLEWQSVLDIFFTVPHEELAMVSMYVVSTHITFHTAYQQCEPIILYFVAMRTHYKQVFQT